VLGVDYAREATEAARRLAHDVAADTGGTVAPTPAFSVAQMDALALGLADGSFDAVCSSHLIEHFADPSVHVAEVARVTADNGTAYFLTPNAPADFENPFHLRLFGPGDLGELLCAYFGEVWVGGVDATDRVKADFAARRAKAEKLLRLDVFDLRHRIPRRWYVALYTRLLPVAYALVARESHPASALAPDDWFVTEDVDETTLVLFAVCRRPRR
jgi:SAM-dependent methyltransferase